MSKSEFGERDRATVTPEGERIMQLIDGVVIRKSVAQIDERGEVVEIYNPAWGTSPDPLVYVYQASIRPGKFKGWVYHKQQLDRLFLSLGSLKIILHDLRENSPTKGMTNEIYITERNRSLLIIPPLVAHLLQNIGETEAVFVNMPSKPYNHSNPDKYRIDINSGIIPYKFNARSGW